ncbi:hypothetical protein SSP24_45360 [Streptomyces spinoverrucosus]|uniref:Uncharacterized protein n=1 Tax=Streptomyces spinoverrucosus TaxID=284043 RepID=A0A4Y3VMD7_9ACTN|nr:hypothetical protein [Streptomyces spinoverrucosus]GEC06881.1 hypothetical protein SSP24_45360 [Streptomyces spinoverrucosus]GHB85182.1 hypothetical protein GCM10010397_65740 [Streptomyces spinoverrucosus]
MGTKTVDETPAETGAEAEAKTDEERVEEAADATATEADTDPGAEDGDAQPEASNDAGPSGVGQGAGAVVAVALGIVSLTGSWVGTVASARESLIGQLQTSQTSSVATMVKEGYGDAWAANALWAGVFALAALIVGVVVLARPAFGAPGKPQAPWIKSVAWAGVSLGVIGLFLAVLKYTGVLLGLPATG